LLARMKTNPEEFLKDNSVPYDGDRFGGKWSDLIDYAWRVATEEERKVLNTARDEFYRDDFNERVMKRLAGEEQEQEEHPMQKFRIKTPQQMPQQQMAQNQMLKQQMAQNQMLRNSVTISNGGTGAQGAMQSSVLGSSGGSAMQYDPDIHVTLTTTGSFQPAEHSSEKAGFWGGITKSLGGR